MAVCVSIESCYVSIHLSITRVVSLRSLAPLPHRPHCSRLTLSGGNEWYGKLPATLFEQFVLPTIAAEDMTRPVWPASPSAGLAAGVYTLTGLPNGKPFRIVDQYSSACCCRHADRNNII